MPGHDRSERGGDARVIHVGDVALTFDLEVVNVGQEGFANLGGGAGKINEHAAGIDHVDAETMRFEPGGDDVKVGLRKAELFAEFLRRQPMMEIGRVFGVEFIDELLEGLFLFRRAPELKEHVLHCEVVRYRTAIVREDGFGMRVPFKREAIRFVNGLRDSRARMRAGFYLRKNRRRDNEGSEDNYGEEPRFTKHGSPS